MAQEGVRFVVRGKACAIFLGGEAKSFLDPANLGFVAIEKAASCLAPIPDGLAHGHGAPVMKLVQERNDLFDLIRAQRQIHRPDQSALLVQPFVARVA